MATKKSGKPTISVRKPPPASVAGAFVTGAKGEEKARRLTVYLPPALYKRARVAALEADSDFSAFVAAALEAALAGKR